MYSRVDTLRLYSTQLLQPRLRGASIVPEEDVFMAGSPGHLEMAQFIHRSLIQYNNQPFSLHAKVRLLLSPWLCGMWSACHVGRPGSSLLCPFAQSPTDSAGGWVGELGEKRNCKLVSIESSYLTELSKGGKCISWLSSLWVFFCVLRVSPAETLHCNFQDVGDVFYSSSFFLCSPGIFMSTLYTGFCFAI